MASSVAVAVAVDSPLLAAEHMQFIHQNIGNFEFVQGGFELSVSWGFLVGIFATYILCKYVLFRQSAAARKAGR